MNSIFLQNFETQLMAKQLTLHKLQLNWPFQLVWGTLQLFQFSIHNIHTLKHQTLLSFQIANRVQLLRTQLLDKKLRLNDLTNYLSLKILSNVCVHMNCNWILHNESFAVQTGLLNFGDDNGTYRFMRSSRRKMGNAVAIHMISIVLQMIGAQFYAIQMTSYEQYLHPPTLNIIEIFFLLVISSSTEDLYRGLHRCPFH